MGKVAICIPVHGDTKALFTLSLAGMVQRSVAELTGELKTFMAQGHLLDNRNGLAKAARDWGADWILWLDADHTFPDDTLIRLLAHDLDVVGCNYVRRRPAGPVAVKGGHPLYSDKGGPVEEVDTLGLGVCLMRASVFDSLDWPWFTVERSTNGTGHVSEDVCFFRALKRAGIVAHVDHALSWQVGHAHEHFLMNSDLRGQNATSILAPAGDQ